MPKTQWRVLPLRGFAVAEPVEIVSEVLSVDIMEDAGSLMTCLKAFVEQSEDSASDTANLEEKQVAADDIMEALLERCRMTNHGISTEQYYDEIGLFKKALFYALYPEELEADPDYALITEEHLAKNAEDVRVVLSRNATNRRLFRTKGQGICGRGMPDTQRGDLVCALDVETEGRVLRACGRLLCGEVRSNRE
jgi:hypothetical protein